MKVYNIIYKDLKTFIKFINENNIARYNKVLIQILSGICDKDILIELSNNIKNVLPQAKIIGSASSNFMYGSSFVSDNIYISITVFEGTDINTYLIRKNEKISFYNCGRLLAQKLINNNTKLLIILASGDEIDGSKILKGINSVDSNSIVCGGFISNNNNLNNSFVFNENNTADKGIVGVSFEGNKIDVSTDCYCEFLLIGCEHVVTDAHNYVINTIDGVPAYDFYSKYLKIGNKSSAIAMGTEVIFISVKRNKLIPIPIDGFTDDGGLHLVSKIKTGDKIIIGYQSFKHMLNDYRNLKNNECTDCTEAAFAYINDTINGNTKDLIINSSDISLNFFFTYAQFYKNKRVSNYGSNFFTIVKLYENVNNKNEGKLPKKIFTYDDFQKDMILCNLIESSKQDYIEIHKTLKREIRQKDKQLKLAYYTDSLTKLENRNKLIDDILNKRFNKLALIEINSFNEISDFYGNWTRDVILIEFSKVISSFAKKNGMKVYKIDSDVFALLDSTQLRKETFIKLIKKFQNDIENHCFFYNKNKIFISVRAGISINEDFLIEKADMALNYAKKQHKQIQQYSKNLQISKQFKDNLTCLRKIKYALKNDKIVPYFQPIYNNATHKLEKYEALIRMIDEDGKLILPNYFLDAAVKSGIYSELTRVMINKTFEVFENIEKDFSINLLVDDILDPHTRKFILNKLKKYKNSKHVIFEIVENEEIDNYKQVSEFIEKVHEYGAKIAVDDFGAGYSNFEYIMKLNIDYIKIDGSIIKNIANDNSAQIIAETIVSFSKKLNIYTVAEYVHDEKTYNKIRNINIDFSQGYYLSKPKPYVEQ